MLRASIDLQIKIIWDKSVFAKDATKFLTIWNLFRDILITAPTPCSQLAAAWEKNAVAKNFGKPANY